MGVTMKKGAATLASLTYDRTNGDLLRQEVQTGLPGNATTSYGYNCLNQLSWTKNGAASAACNASAPSGSTVFSYDPSDNLTTGTAGTQTFPNANSNQMATAGSTAFGYDSRGNRTSMAPSGQAATAYTYDQANRLTTYWPQSANGNDGEYTPLVGAGTQPRIMDTRTGQNIGSCDGAACSTFNGTAVKNLQVTGAGLVPGSNVDSVVVTVTALNGTVGGYVVAWPQGATMPATSVLNFAAGQTISNTAIVKVSASGKIAFTVGGLPSGQTADLIVDVQGYYATQSGSAGSEFTAINPTRPLDTLVPTGTCNPSPCGTITGGTNRKVKVAVVAGDSPNAALAPVGTTSVAINVTTVNASAGGYLTAYKGDLASPPSMTTVSYSTGQVIAGFTIVKPDSQGYIRIFASATTDVVVDIEGYNTAAPAGAGSDFVENPTTTRLVDTRYPTNPCTATANPCGNLGAGATTVIKVVGGLNTGGTTTSPVPAGASAVVVNLTALPGASGGYMTLYPGDGATPTTSNLNYAANATIANLAIVKLGADGTLKLTNSQGSGVGYVVDVLGWYTNQWSYADNTDGLRTSKTAPDATQTTFTWDKSGGLPMLLTETTAGASTHYLYGPGGLPYAQIAPDGTTTYLHHDQLGSTRAITDASGNIVGSATYNPYGTVNAVGLGTATSHFGFAGQYTDPESGLQYLRARFYEPASGQFLTRDPVAAVTRSAYGYAANSPQGATDPTGLFFNPIDTVVGVVEGGVDLVTGVGETGVKAAGSAMGGLLSLFAALLALPGDKAEETMSKDQINKIDFGSQRPILIGQTQSRVITAAAAVNAETFPTWQYPNTPGGCAQWVEDSRRLGKAIIDIGHDDNSKYRSDFYEAEREIAYQGNVFQMYWPPGEAQG